jgi:hypothetical protein
MPNQAVLQVMQNQYIENLKTIFLQIPDDANLQQEK